MKTTVYQSDFVDAFRQTDRDNNFSYYGKIALFEFLEELEEDAGIELELDVIAICCDFTEYESIDEYNWNYGTDCETIEHVMLETTVIPVDDERFIIQNH